MLLRKQKPVPRLHQLTPITDRALSLPEILHCIFQYLTQSELKSITSLVSRSWHQSSYVLIQRTLAWVDFECTTDGEIPTHVINALKSDLHCLVYRRPSLLELQQHRADLLRGEQSKGHPTSTRLDTFAREAKETNWVSLVQELRVYSDIHAEARLMVLLTVCRHITSLSMDLNYHNEIDLTTLMNECSRLTFLSIAGVENSPFTTRPGYHTLTGNPELFTGTYSLQYLILKRVRLEQEPLLALLRHLPSLLHYNTMDLEQGPIMNSRHIVDALFLHCPKLKGFAFSQRAGEHVGGHELGLVMSNYSNLTDLGLYSVAIWRATLRSVAQHGQNLTTLTIHHAPKTGAVPFEYVHNYLCSAPNLLHFYGLSTKMDVACFIQEDGRRITGTWACRGLKTLHMGISNQYCQTFKSSTLVYYYLIKVCPEIQNLSLRPSYAWGSMEIGLRILKNLKDLQDLTFHVDSWRMEGTVYLDWMIKESSPSVWEHPAKIVQSTLDALSISMRSKRQKRLRRLHGYREESEDMAHSGESRQDSGSGDTKAIVSSRSKNAKGKSVQKDEAYWTQLKTLTIHCREKQVACFEHVESTFRQQRPDIMVKIDPSYPPLRLCRLF
ncbi:hypothetical protein CPB97_000741 [Podila verticillata]|nr:hypothetical protein CPB97_000741 [Podila verticillata]